MLLRRALSQSESAPPPLPISNARHVSSIDRPINYHTARENNGRAAPFVKSYGVERNPAGMQSCEGHDARKVTCSGALLSAVAGRQLVHVLDKGMQNKNYQLYLLNLRRAEPTRLVVLCLFVIRVMFMVMKDGVRSLK